MSAIHHAVVVVCLMVLAAILEQTARTRPDVSAHDGQLRRHLPRVPPLPAKPITARVQLTVASIIDAKPSLGCLAWHPTQPTHFRSLHSVSRVCDAPAYTSHGVHILATICSTLYPGAITIAAPPAIGCSTTGLTCQVSAYHAVSACLTKANVVDPRFRCVPGVGAVPTDPCTDNVYRRGAYFIIRVNGDGMLAMEQGVVVKVPYPGPVLTAANAFSMVASTECTPTPCYNLWLGPEPLVYNEASGDIVYGEGVPVTTQHAANSVVVMQAGDRYLTDPQIPGHNPPAGTPAATIECVL